MYCNMTGEYTYFLDVFQFSIKHSTTRSITTASRSTAAATTPPIIAPVFEGWKGASVAGWIHDKRWQKRELKILHSYIFCIMYDYYIWKQFEGSLTNLNFTEGSTKCWKTVTWVLKDVLSAGSSILAHILVTWWIHCSANQVQVED